MKSEPNQIQNFLQKNKYLKNSKRSTSMAFAISGIATVGLILLERLFGFGESLELKMFDRWVRMQPQLASERIVLVGITEEDLNNQAIEPLSEELHTDLIAKIQTQQPRAIGLVIFHSSATTGAETKLNRQMQANNFVGIAKLTGSESNHIEPHPSLLVNQNYGDATALFDPDGIIRRNYLYSITDTSEPVASLALKVAQIYLQGENIQPEIEQPHQWLRLGAAVFPPLENYQGGYRSIKAFGYQFISRWQFPLKSYQRVSIEEVVAGRIPTNLFRDRIILIGSLAPSLKDNFFTPHSNQQRYYGLEIQASFIDQIIATALGETKFLNTPAQLLEYIFALAIASAITYLIWQQRFYLSISRFIIQVTTIIVLSILGILGLSFLLFINGIWLAATTNLLIVTSIGFILPIYIYRIRELQYYQLLANYNLELEQEVKAKNIENKKYQETLIEEEKLAFLGRLSQSIYHHSNNHLATLSAHAYLLKQINENLSDSILNLTEDIPLKIGKHFQKEAKSIQAILDSVENIKIFFSTILGQIDGTNKLNFGKTLNLKQIVETAIYLANKSRLKSTDKIDIQTEYSPEILNNDNFNLDTSSLMLLLVHFIDNSIDAILTRLINDENLPPDYQGEIKIIASRSESNYLLFQVQDNGIGIAPEVKDVLFKKPFISTKESGLGIGLYLCQKILDRNSWSISVESTPNCATTLELTIPPS